MQHPDIFSTLVHVSIFPAAMTWFSPRAPKSCWRSSSRPDTRWSSPQRPWSGLTVTWRTNTPTSGRATGSWAQGVSPSVLSVTRFVNPLKQQHVGKMTVESHVFTWENSPTFKLATHWMVLKLFLLQSRQRGHSYACRLYPCLCCDSTNMRTHLNIRLDSMVWNYILFMAPPTLAAQFGWCNSVWDWHNQKCLLS